MIERKDKPQSGRRRANSACNLTKDSCPEHIKIYNEKADNPVEKRARGLNRYCLNEPI